MVLATLQRLADRLRAVLSDLDPERLSGTDASKLLEAFSDIEKLAAGGKLLTARRVESSNVWRSQGHRSAASHIAQESGTSLGPAINTLQTARQLSGLPAAEEAVRKGRLSAVQAKEVAGAASSLPEAEGELVQAAVHEPVNVLKLRCRRAKATGEGSSTNYRAVHRSRYLRNWIDDDGAVRLDAKLAPDAGARLLGAVKSETRYLRDGARRAGVDDPERALAADALVGLACRSAGDADVAPSVQQGDRPTGPARGRAAAPTRRRSDRAGGRKDAAGPKGARGEQGEVRRWPDPESGGSPQAMVHVRVDHGALVRGHTEGAEVCEIPGVGPIPVEVARQLAGDSILSVLVTDGVDVTAVAHAGRTIPASIRRALVERDPVCVVPGCEVREELEIDHVVPFGEGGPTALSNLARLCHWHHYLKTYQRYRLERRGRRWEWTPPVAAGATRLC